MQTKEGSCRLETIGQQRFPHVAERNSPMAYVHAPNSLVRVFDPDTGHCLQQEIRDIPFPEREYRLQLGSDHRSPTFVLRGYWRQLPEKQLFEVYFPFQNIEKAYKTGLYLESERRHSFEWFKEVIIPEFHEAILCILSYLDAEREKRRIPTIVTFEV
jgi:hypothetical protein